ncbi:hypothetical protein [Sphingomonas endolithica]|uniref:hypothetical protein n=1 Tax=Sphingomonas endolithica TaxID=2972485 RepID=UPI0021AE8958|nr:hypothetical protein [Sphingomonas sp. ZFBP2030]
MTKSSSDRVMRNGKLRYGPTGRPQVLKDSGWHWNDAAEAAFFDHLAASCNVTAAAEAVGFSTPTVYRLRQTRPEFAARWQAALEQGYARLELALLKAAVDTIDDVPFDVERPTPKMTVDQAMNVLRAHRNSVVDNGRGGPGKTARRRSLDEVRASILSKVEAIRSMDAAPADSEARGGDAA